MIRDSSALSFWPDGRTPRVRIVDHGDTTGTRYEYNEEGEQVHEIELTDLPIPAAPELTDEQRASARAEIDDDFAAAIQQAQTMEEIRQAAATRETAIDDLSNS